MTITVTGATGKLGRLIIQELLARNVAATDIVAVARRPEAADDLAALGVQIRRADYDDVGSLVAAFANTKQLMFVSGSELDKRSTQHRNVVEAASRAGVPYVSYTSLINAGTSGVSLAADHRDTEHEIRESGLAFTFLRNGWYLENYTENLAPTLAFKTLIGAAGDGRLSAASRVDYAAAAAVVLTGSGHEGAVYELGGDPAFTLTDLAAVISEVTSTQVSYVNLAPEQMVGILVSANVPKPVAEMLVSADQGTGRGDLYSGSGDLTRLIGRATTTPRSAVTAATVSA